MTYIYMHDVFDGAYLLATEDADQAREVLAWLTDPENFDQVGCEVPEAIALRIIDDADNSFEDYGSRVYDLPDTYGDILPTQPTRGTVTNSKVCVRGTNYDIEVFDHPRGWHALGFFGDLEIDTRWVELDGLTFEELDAHILDLITDELN